MWIACILSLTWHIYYCHKNICFIFIRNVNIGAWAWANEMDGTRIKWRHQLKCSVRQYETFSFRVIHKHLNEQCLRFSTLWGTHIWDAEPPEMHGLKVKLFVKFIIAFSQHKIVSTIHTDITIPFVISPIRNVHAHTVPKGKNTGSYSPSVFNWVIQSGWIWSYLWIAFFIPFKLTNYTFFIFILSFAFSKINGMPKSLMQAFTNQLCMVACAHMYGANVSNTADQNTTEWDNICRLIAVRYQASSYKRYEFEKKNSSVQFSFNRPSALNESFNEFTVDAEPFIVT